MDESFEDTFFERRRRITQVDENTVSSAFACPVWTSTGYKTPATVWFGGGAVVIDQTSAYAPLLQPTLTQGGMTPLILRAILAAADGTFPYNERLRLRCGGGTLRWAEIQQVKQRITPYLLNAFGSTETNTFGLTPVESPEDLRWHRLVPGAEVEVVDENDQPLPAGQVGRVRIGTADGPDSYLNDENATAVFFRNGFFYPGDLGFRREDGRLALQGRVTEVINIDGVKISPGPIEERLADAVGAPVILLTIPNDTGDEELHMAIESAALPATEVLANALRAEFGQDVRAHAHAVPVFPRTATGKVMRPRMSDQLAAAGQESAL